MHTSETHWPSLLKAFGWIILAYITSFIAGWYSLSFVEDYHLIWQLAVADTVATIVIFAFSVVFQNSSFYDAYWSVAPPFLALFWIINPMQSDIDMVRLSVVLSLVGFWAWRLTFNWTRGWTGLQHEDWRYIDLKNKTGKAYWLVSFLGIHYFPTVLVFLSSLPLIPALADNNEPFNYLDYFAIIVTLGAIIIETTADEQLRTAVQTGKLKKGEIYTGGVWKFSRHPNYFGELAFWWGLFFFGLAANPAYWWTIIGPFSMTLLFYFISVPMMDKRSIERRKGYAEHIKNTSAIIPWFPKK